MSPTSIPLIDGAWNESIAWFEGRWISRAAFVADVQALQARLPSASHLINLCEDRYRFTVAFCAIACAKRVNLLPSSAGEHAQSALLAMHPGAGTIRDADVPVGHGSASTVPRLDPLRIIAEVMTSGSTGTPRCLRKTWHELAAAARLSFAALTPNAGSVHLVATVPPQHMYGLETTVFYALQGNAIVHHARPFFPADIRQALEQIDAPQWLVTTPIHLRTLVRSEVSLPSVELLISATAPLSRDLAAEAEARFQAPVHEIYGSTEAGSLATRRVTQHDAHWHLHAGLRLEPAAQHHIVHAPYRSEPFVLDDEIEPQDERRFRLLGRNADVIKVAGKRASLAELTQTLLAVPGVHDAAVWIPDGQERPAALVVAPHLSIEQILSVLSTHVDPVFLPRPLRLVDGLPRNALGKLPREALLRMMAR